MTSSVLPSFLRDFPPRWSTQVNRSWVQKPVTIALINNMPDAALRATERQFCSLLSAASTGLLVQLKLYSLPGVRHSETAQAHISDYYEDFRTLEEDPPDGLIMTGTEPSFACLREEAFWPSMAYVINLCHDRCIPAIWSCLAAHAAVLEMDGVTRIRLPRKLSGAFECRLDTGKHQIFHRLPGKWVVPHSRFNGLRRADLERSGYDIVSGSREVGVDLFMKHGDCIQLFLQGHPEYDPGVLAAEYRRDVLRKFRGQQAHMPDLPRGIWGRWGRAREQEIIRAIRDRNETTLLADLEKMAQELRPRSSWHGSAQRLFRNWIAYIDAREHLTIKKRIAYA